MQGKQVKTFIFERQQTSQSIILEHQIPTAADSVSLDALFEKHFSLKEHRISIYDPKKYHFEDMSSVVNQKGQFPQYFFEPTFILVRYSSKSPQTMDTESHKSSIMSHDINQEEKEKRSRERTIGQVLEIVKKWRQIHLNGFVLFGKHLNLQQAAKLVGISKKSLDDYYCQLRLGQLYHFDYLNNLKEKIGVLRNFVKNYRPEKNNSKKRQHEKHPKTLKILNYFDVESKQLIDIDELLKEEQYKMHKRPEPLIAETEQIRQEHNQHKQQMAEAQFQGQILHSSPVDYIERPRHLTFLEDNFFNTFEIPLDGDADPYYELDRDFRGRDMDFDESPMFGF